MIPTGNSSQTDNCGTNRCPWLAGGDVTPSGGKRSQPAEERGLARQARSGGHGGRGGRRLCNVSVALGGALSSRNQISEVTPSAYPARGLHTVVRATTRDVGWRDVCVKEVFRLQLWDVLGESQDPGLLASPESAAWIQVRFRFICLSSNQPQGGAEWC